MYYSLCCRKCGKYSSREINNIRKYQFKCFYCNKISKLKTKGMGLSMHLTRFDTFQEASNHVKEKNTRGKVGFATYSYNKEV